MDKRSKSEQVRSGFQIVGSLIIGFIVLVMLIGGFTLLSDQQGSKTVAWMALAVAATVLFCTANRWASIVGATLGPALIKILIAILEPSTQLRCPAMN